MASHTVPVSLLEVEPGIGRFLSEKERSEARGVSVPVRIVEEWDADLDALLEDSGAFGALVLDGMVLHRFRVGEQPVLRVLGPGEIVSASTPPPSMLLFGAGYRATSPTRLALLGNEVIHAARRWPGLIGGLQVKMGEQVGRISTQLAICQLSRVDERLLAMFWFLAESWGRVTSMGTTLPLTMTHDTLGCLIGARRSTVTLALGNLTERGAVIQQASGWLLLERPPSLASSAEKVLKAAVVADSASQWKVSAPQSPPGDAHAAIQDSIHRLREQHRKGKEQLRDQRETLRRTVVRSALLRQKIMRDAFRWPQAPSS